MLSLHEFGNPGFWWATMIDRLIRTLVLFLLSLRYRITVRGLDAIAPKDGRGILFLPNHPALIEPIIMIATLQARFRVGVLADRAQIDRPVIRTLAKRLDVKAISDPGRERDAKSQIDQMLADVIAGLNRGESLLMYPAGRIYRSRFEELGANSAVETILSKCPSVRIVVARTEGLWGSSFSRAAGGPPSVDQALRRGLWGLLKSGFWFMPKRDVTLTFREEPDLRAKGDRNAINRYLEAFYNEEVTPNTWVPYSCWGSSEPQEIPEPTAQGAALRDIVVPEATEAIVMKHLGEVTGMKTVTEDMRLATDLGLDSLARVELQAYIESEFGFPQSDGDAFDTVRDVLYAACGEGNVGTRAELKSIAPAWFRAQARAHLMTAPGETVTEAFLNAAEDHMDRVIVADQNSGTRTYRDLITGIFVLKSELEQEKGSHVGILLPASVAAVLAYLATLFAGKTPVMLNWTTGPRGVEHALENLGIECVISARPLLDRLKGEGFGQATKLLATLFYLDDLPKRLTLGRKLAAAFRARFAWGSLRHAPCSKHAVVLFTSGSENLPKAVPLTHKNVLTNNRDVLRHVELSGRDAMVAILPPFHSFGLTANILLPLLSGLRVVYHSNPTESAKVATIIGGYGGTILVGTPTFLGGIVGAAKPGQLASLRLAVTGAEACPPRVYDSLAERCPETRVLEGYGITECSPVVSVNLPGTERRGTIGRALDSVETRIVDPETLLPVPEGERGMLLVRGPSIFEGYLNYSGDSPFVEVAGKSYYRTGDLVLRDPDQSLTFLGRMKRFIKLGGEMISLPAIESVLGQKYPAPGEDGPNLAVECTSGEHQELVLFATFEIEREVVNQALRGAGLSPLHNIRQIRRVDKIPMLGTGKTDYRALKAQL